MATHYIITNRHVTNQTGSGFIQVNGNEYLRIDGDEESQENLRYGTISFNPKKAKKLEDFQIKLFPDPKKEDLMVLTETGILPSNKKLPSEKVFDDLYRTGLKAEKANNREDILFFIHGYKSDLETAMQTVRELHVKYVEPKESPIKHIVMFTWPAKASYLRYRDDARDAITSGYALARSYATMKEFFRKTFVLEGKEQCRQKIHLMCHSMGNRVLESMIIKLSDQRNELLSTFSEIILVGADIDYDALEQPKPLYKIIDLGERVHVYYHNNDWALGISELTKNSFNRLGKWGSRNSMNLADDIYQANVTDISDDDGIIHDAVHHWYYINANSVVRDITEVFQGQESVFTLV